MKNRESGYKGWEKIVSAWSPQSGYFTPSTFRHCDPPEGVNEYIPMQYNEGKHTYICPFCGDERKAYVLERRAPSRIVQ